MGFLNSHREQRASNVPSVPLSSGDPALLGMFGASSSNSAQNVTADTALNVSTVYACVNRISNTLAMLPLNIMRRIGEGKEIAKDHRLFKQISAKPNNWQTSFDWRKQMEVHRQLRGNAYSLIVPVTGRGMNQLIPMDPDRVWPFVITPSGAYWYMYDNSSTPPAGSRLFYQYFPINGTTIILPADEVLHIKGLSSNGIVGKNVVKLMRESIGLAMSTEEQGARLFSNGAQIGKVFKHPSKLGDETFDRLKKELNQYSGVNNAHRTLILEDGMDIAQTTLTMEDAQFLDTRKFQVEDICSFMDVPLILINRSGDKNQTYASAEQIISLFITHQMAPHFICWEQSLNDKLLYDSEQKNYYFDFNFDAMMRGDSKARAEYLYNRFKMASMCPDDIRIYEGENPTGTEEGKKYYIQSGTMPVDMAGKSPIVNTKPINKNDDKEGDLTNDN